MSHGHVPSGSALWSPAMTNEEPAQQHTQGWFMTHTYLHTALTPTTTICATCDSTDRIMGPLPRNHMAQHLRGYLTQSAQLWLR
jgi:hypothetical protein